MGFVLPVGLIQTGTGGGVPTDGPGPYKVPVSSAEWQIGGLGSAGVVAERN